MPRVRRDQVEEEEERCTYTYLCGLEVHLTDKGKDGGNDEVILE